MSDAPTLAVSEVPLTPQPQSFQITLGGNQLNLTFLYRDAEMGGWTVDIYNSAHLPIVCGVPLITGADLLAQYAYLEFGGQLWVVSDGYPTAVPTFFNLGVVPGGHLYWIPDQ